MNSIEYPMSGGGDNYKQMNNTFSETSQPES